MRNKPSLCQCRWSPAMSQGRAAWLVRSQSFGHQLFLTQTHGDRALCKRSWLQSPYARAVDIAKKIPIILLFCLLPLLSTQSQFLFRERWVEDSALPGLAFMPEGQQVTVVYVMLEERKCRKSLKVWRSTLRQCWSHLNMLRKAWSSATYNPAAEPLTSSDSQSKPFSEGIPQGQDQRGLPRSSPPPTWMAGACLEPADESGLSLGISRWRWQTSEHL